MEECTCKKHAHHELLARRNGVGFVARLPVWYGDGRVAIFLTCYAVPVCDCMVIPASVL